jgi:hypothetical protein
LLLPLSLHLLVCGAAMVLLVVLVLRLLAVV